MIRLLRRAAADRSGTAAIEFVLIRSELSVANARKLLVVDQIFGAASGIVLIVGFLRVFLFEKGAAYYFHSAPFIGKLSLFIAVGLLSIYPTIVFLSWRAAVRQGLAPTPPPEKVRMVRKIIHWELMGVVLILLCAALMARGVGYVSA